jgi:hypothetical protein
LRLRHILLWCAWQTAAKVGIASKSPNTARLLHGTQSLESCIADAAQQF